MQEHQNELHSLHALLQDEPMRVEMHAGEEDSNADLRSTVKQLQEELTSAYGLLESEKETSAHFSSRIQELEQHLREAADKYVSLLADMS